MTRIIYVNVLGGPPFQFVLEKMQKLGEVLVVQPEHISDVERRQLESITSHVRYADTIPVDMEFATFLAKLADEVRADAMLTFDEFYLNEVSVACARAGLPGAGPAVQRSIRKDVMYEALQRHGLLQRPWVASVQPLELLDAPIEAPFVIKPSSCAGSLGIFSVDKGTSREAVARRLQGAKDAVQRLIRNMPQKSYLSEQPFLKEGLLVGEATQWFGAETPYADYLSVEGAVVRGRYHAIAITQNYPMLDPFIETVSMSPCTLPLEVQKGIVERITPFFESIKLETCGTHTEIKLLANGEVAVIESAARFAGWSIIPQIDTVFSFDAIGELVQCMLDPKRDWPATFEEVYARRRGAAATINLLPASPVGEAWSPAIYARNPDLSVLVSDETRWRFTPYIDVGSPLPDFSIYDGAWNSFGKIFLTAVDIDTLHRDIQRIRNDIRDLVV